MAKKGFGKLVALAAVAGAAAAGISYVLRYKTFHKELEKDFHEFEDDGAEEEEEGAPSARLSSRTAIISLSMPAKTNLKWRPRTWRKPPAMY